MGTVSLARRRRHEDGASAVEFALVVVPLLVIVFGIFQYGWYFYSSQVGASTAREAARRLAVGDCTVPAELRAFVESRLGPASLASPTIATAYTKANGTPTAPVNTPEIGGKVTVTITFQSLDMNFPFVPVPNDAEITREVDSRVEDTNATGCA